MPKPKNGVWHDHRTDVVLLIAQASVERISLSASFSSSLVSLILSPAYPPSPDLLSSYLPYLLSYTTHASCLSLSLSLSLSLVFLLSADKLLYPLELSYI